MARGGYPPVGGSAWLSKVQRPESDQRVVYYQHSDLLEASFLQRAQQTRSSFLLRHSVIIRRSFGQSSC